MADALARSVARSLETYLAQHPAAADTAQGIAQWWLPPPMRPGVATVEQALAMLVAAGVVERRLLPDGRQIYGRSGQPAPPSGGTTED
jgi:hypothetical protein